jgi:hypothetical protein
MIRLLSIAGDRVDAASLGVFRLAFGLIMLTETGRFFLHGWIKDHYLDPPFLFKYYGFEWVPLPPGSGLYWIFGAMGLAAVLVALGVLFRAAIVGLFILFAYVFLLDQASYLNQYYLLLSVALILCFLPADRAFSIASRRINESSSPVTPRWSIWAIRFQFELVLLFAGLVKLNDDWLQGQPLGLWFAERAAIWPLLGPWLTLPGVEIVSAYTVVLLHLAGAPLLFWRRTRLAVFALYAGFHLANSLLFQIGIFPWLTLMGTLMFFDPSWPRQLIQRLNGRDNIGSDIPIVRGSTSPPNICVVFFLTIFFAFQLLFPLRFLLYPGNVSWTNEGHWFSWRMKLNDRRATSRFIVTDAKGPRSWTVYPEDVLRPRQIQLMSINPDMVLQFAHYLERIWARDRDIRNVEVRAIVFSSLNGRAPAPLVDPQRDLTTVSRSLGHYEWIVPLSKPLPRTTSGEKATSS